MERFATLSCIHAYAHEYPTRGNVLLVTQSTVSAVKWSTDYTDTAWMCNAGPEGQCEARPEMKQWQEDPTSWKPGVNLESAYDFTPAPKSIAYCLSEVRPGHCKVQFSLQLAAVVIVIFLQLSYRFSIPLIVMSVFLHWLVS